jgi:hypothetical protein
MSTEKNRIYVGKGKKTDNYDLVNISLSRSKLENHWYEYEGEHYIKLTVGALRQTDQYGKTHSVWINDYKPNGQNEQQVSNSKPVEANVSEGDLPF